jgi:hypothetical protein
MKEKKIVLIILALISLNVLLISAVKQVRVTADKAAIYLEPNRNSTRVEIVTKGTVLNLLQPNKIKELWYYVSFTSPRYGTRISGFIQEIAVELVVEGAAPPVKKELEKPAEKAQPQPPAAKTVPVPAPAAPKVQAPPKIEEVLVLTALPRGKSWKLPGKEPVRQEPVWQTITVAPPPVPPPAEVKKVITPSEVIILTPALRSKAIALPKREKSIEDPAWPFVEKVAAEQRPVPEIKKEEPKGEAPPQPKPLQPKPEVKKEQPEVKKTEPEQARPVRPAAPRPARGLVILGLGYGSSFGGAGGFLQLNTRTGFSLHAGGGLYPTKLIYSGTNWVENKPLYSFGIKYYLPFRSSTLYPYIDAQFGGQRIEAAQVIIGIWEYSYVYSHEQKALWGPSFLAGTEVRFGRIGINTAVGISYTTTKWDFLESKIALAFDASLVVYF